MADLEPPDLHHLKAAHGWTELGNPTEALAELARIGPEHAEHVDVLEAHWHIRALRKDWAQAVEIAQLVLTRYPDEALGWIHLAYALHELGRTGEAYTALLGVEPEFRPHRTILYNLACYACVLGRRDEARRWFKRALQTGEADELRRVALRDRDLEGLWPEVPSL